VNTRQVKCYKLRAEHFGFVTGTAPSHLLSKSEAGGRVDLGEDRVAVGRQSQRTIEAEVVGWQVLAAVARVAERDVAALLAASLSPIQDGRRARDGRHDGKADADSQARTVPRLVVQHIRVVVVVVIVFVETASTRVCRNG